MRRRGVSLSLSLATGVLIPLLVVADARATESSVPQPLPTPSHPAAQPQPSSQPPQPVSQPTQPQPATQPTQPQPVSQPAQTQPVSQPTRPQPADPSSATRPVPESPATPPEAEVPAHPARVRWGVDLPLTLGSVSTFAILEYFVTRQLPLEPLAGTSMISSVDSKAIGHYWPGAALASDVLLYGGVAIPLIYHGVEAGLRRRELPFGRRYGTDVMIYLETLSVNVLLTEILKHAVDRPRPLAYTDPADVPEDVRTDLLEAQADPDSRKSFPSGHASLAFASMVGGATLLTLKLARRRPGVLAAAWVASLGVASTTAALRVVAGKHFTSDVIAGALLGSAVGVAVPMAHWTGAIEGRGRDRERRRRVTARLVPAVSGTTRGLHVVGRF